MVDGLLRSSLCPGRVASRPGEPEMLIRTVALVNKSELTVVVIIAMVNLWLITVTMVDNDPNCVRLRGGWVLWPRCCFSGQSTVSRKVYPCKIGLNAYMVLVHVMYAC